MKKLFLLLILLSFCLIYVFGDVLSLGASCSFYNQYIPGEDAFSSFQFGYTASYFSGNTLGLFIEGILAYSWSLLSSSVALSSNPIEAINVELLSGIGFLFDLSNYVHILCGTGFHLGFLNSIQFAFGIGLYIKLAINVSEGIAIGLGAKSAFDFISLSRLFSGSNCFFAGLYINPIIEIVFGL